MADSGDDGDGDGDDRVTATSAEAFILRLYRQKNKDGFIKAFSDCPEPFTTGFAPLATMMKNLHLRTPSLWPRFHVSVADSLETKQPEVIEINVVMTEAMQQIQTAILQCMETSLSEIKKGNSRELDMEDWNVESALHKNFDVIVRRQLDPVWHRVSWKTRQIVGDLKELREMLKYTTSPPPRTPPGFGLKSEIQLSAVLRQCQLLPVSGGHSGDAERKLWWTGEAESVAVAVPGCGPSHLQRGQNPCLFRKC